MMLVSEAVWSQLAADLEAAERVLDKARAVYDALPLPDNDGPKSDEERAYDDAWRVTSACEDRLLGVEAPSPAGAALQLRLFALRHHSVDLSEHPTEQDDPEAGPLRRIYAALVR